MHKNTLKKLGPFKDVDLAANNVHRTYILYLKGKARFGNKSTLTKSLSEIRKYRDEVMACLKVLGQSSGKQNTVQIKRWL